MPIDTTMMELCETFVAECMDYLDELEPLFIEMAKESAGGDPVRFQSLMNHIFRLIHTVKGSAGSLGFTAIAGLAHRAENLLDALRHHRIPMTADRLDLLTQSLDHFRPMLAHVQKESNDEGMGEGSTALMQELDLSVATDCGPAKSTVKMTEVSPGFHVFDEDKQIEEADDLAPEITPAMLTAFVQEGEETIGKVELQFITLQADKQKVALSRAESLRLLHSLKGNCSFMRLHDMEKLIHVMETVLERCTDSDMAAKVIPDLLKAVDMLKVGLELCQGGAAVKLEGWQELAHGMERLSGVKSALVTAETTKAVDPNKGTRELATSGASSRSDVRVDLKKLDALINLVGELVVAEAMVTGWVTGKGIEDEGLERAVHHLRRTTQNIQDIAMSVRMVPINQTFKKMMRLVHDTSSKLGKKVRLNLIGEDTEIDKTVIEQIADPLVHCVRNSIDHGLETPFEREKSGKEETGTITLEARHEGGEVWVVIKDDGRGLNREKIVKRARERGLITPERESNLTDTEIYNFIFEPGFSTAEKVTDVSGRGVGMDVVKRNIEKVKGRIRVDSDPGQGSRVTFQIPLTLAIIDGMLVRVGNSKFTIPLLSIQESIRVEPGQVTIGPDGLEMLEVRSHFIPIVRLDEVMMQERSKATGVSVVVMVEVNKKSIALKVDEILGQQQTVIKALPTLYKYSRNVSGCSILANGDVSLIVDVAGIADMLSSSYDSMVLSAA